MKMTLIFLSLALFFACSTQQEGAEKLSLPESLKEAVESPYRSAENKKRDNYRHPLQTLSFFGIEPDMTVVEIWPSGGWYTQILAPYLAADGQYIIADPPADPRGYTTKRKEWMKKHPEIASTVERTTFLPPDVVKFAPEDSVDMVLTFRNLHSWKPVSAKKAAFEAFYRALKPGGILGVVAHRAGSDQKTLESKTGYLPEDKVIKLAKEVGFKLAEKSEVNANPLDKANHPKGVWTLPPSLRLGEKNKDKYTKIGESDRMTLKFVKPKK